MEDIKKKKDGKFKGISSLSVPVSGFPIDLWEVWNKQCKKKYQSIRWVKMWSDHLKAQSFDFLIQSKVMVVKDSQEEPTKKEQEELGLLNPETEEKENGK